MSVLEPDIDAAYASSLPFLSSHWHIPAPPVSLHVVSNPLSASIFPIIPAIAILPRPASAKAS